jgi:hypothetical protein
MDRNANKLIVLLLSLSLCPFFVEQALAEDTTEREDLAKRLTAIVALLSDGYAREYEDAREIHIFHPPERSSIAVALFTLEGFARGNNHTQFMAVFATLSEESEDRHPRTRSLLDVAAIGGKGWRSVDSKNVRIESQEKAIAINLNTQEYVPDDPICCPSKKSKTVYVIFPDVRGRLKEVN